MARKIIIGSRGSKLALWQAHFVTNQLKELGVGSELKIIVTKGDAIQNLSFDKIEGKGFFTKEIEDALLNNEIDLAVHSYKDLETNQPDGLKIACTSYRENPADVLIIKNSSLDYKQPFSLKKGAIVGTSSARRKAQMKAFRPDIELKDLRGNVPTRVQKLRDQDYDAIILAKAGIERLKAEVDLKGLFENVFDPREFVAAPAQGVLGLQIREDDTEVQEVLDKLNHPEIEDRVYIERKVLNLMNGGCQLPLGVYCENKNNKFQVWTSMAPTWDATPKRLYVEGPDKEALANQIVEKLKSEQKASVFITRNLKDSSLLKRTLDANGVNLNYQSLITFKQIDFTDNPVTDWVFFSSKNSVKYFFEQNPKLGGQTKFAAIGKATEGAIKSHGHNCKFVGYSVDTIEIGQQFAEIAKGESVLFPQSDISLQNVQKQMDAEFVNDLVTYKTTVVASANIPEADVLIFTSPSNVDAFMSLSSITANQKVIALGTSTAKQLQKHNITPAVVPNTPTEVGVLDAVFSVI
jgi:hydroxymethylbilane synthase